MGLIVILGITHTVKGSMEYTEARRKREKKDQAGVWKVLNRR